MTKTMLAFLLLQPQWHSLHDKKLQGTSIGTAPTRLQKQDIQLNDKRTLHPDAADTRSYILANRVQ